MKLLSPEEAGKRLGMSRTTVIRKLKAGDIRAIKVDNRYRIPVREFEAYRDELMAAVIAAASDDIESNLYGERSDDHSRRHAQASPVKKGGSAPRRGRQVHRLRTLGD